MDTVSKQKPAILVDWDLYSYSKTVREYVMGVEDLATLVLLVSDPEHNNLRDLGADLGGWPQDVEWDVVISNTSKTKTDLQFKVHAFEVLSTVSNLSVAIVIDADVTVRDELRCMGALIVMSDTDCANA